MILTALGIKKQHSGSFILKCKAAGAICETCSPMNRCIFRPKKATGTFLPGTKWPKAQELALVPLSTTMLHCVHLACDYVITAFSDGCFATFSWLALAEF